MNDIPDYETLMLPILKVAGDGQEHRISDVIERLARDFQLTEAQRQQLLPSGKQTAFSNRAHWAKTYLVQAGLLEATKRAISGSRIGGAGSSLKGRPASIKSTSCNLPSLFNFSNAAASPKARHLQTQPKSACRRRRR